MVCELRLRTLIWNCIRSEENSNKRAHFGKCCDVFGALCACLYWSKLDQVEQYRQYGREAELRFAGQGHQEDTTLLWPFTVPENRTRSRDFSGTAIQF